MEEKNEERTQEKMKKNIIDHVHKFNTTRIINCFLHDINICYTKEQDNEEVGGNFLLTIVP